MHKRPIIGSNKQLSVYLQLILAPSMWFESNFDPFGQGKCEFIIVGVAAINIDIPETVHVMYSHWLSYKIIEETKKLVTNESLLCLI